MPTFSHTCPVATSPERLWTLLRDVQRVAGLFPYVEINDFAETAPDRYIFQRHLRVPSLVELRWTEEAWVSGSQELSFKAVGGDLQTFHGRWLAESAGDGAQVTLDVTYEIPEGFGAMSSSPMAAYVMNQVFQTICGRVKEVAEEDA